MKTVIFYSLILIFITTKLSLFGQNNPNKIIKDVTSSSIVHSKNNDVIIINENNTIDILGQKARFITFSITKKQNQFKNRTGCGLYYIYCRNVHYYC